MTSAGPDPRKHFFPDSLCHDCGAPPRYITNRRGSTFLFCPLFKRYPPQPVRECEKFLPRAPVGQDVAGRSRVPAPASKEEGRSEPVVPPGEGEG